MFDRPETIFTELRKQFPSDIVWDVVGRPSDRLFDDYVDIRCRRREGGTWVIRRINFDMRTTKGDFVILVFEAMQSAYGDFLEMEHIMRAGPRPRWAKWHARNPRVAKPRWPSYGG